MKKLKRTASLLLSFLLILLTLPGVSLALSPADICADEEGSAHISLTVGETAVVTVDGTQEIAESSGIEFVSAQIIHYTTGVSIPYAATASASQEGWSFDGVSYSADLVLDGDTSTYYLSDGYQKKGDWVTVDVGTVVFSNAVQVSSFKGNYCTGANVQISSDGNYWTTIGTYSGSSSQIKTNIYPFSPPSEGFRYIRVLLSNDAVMNWNLAEISWGKRSNQVFYPDPVSGTVTVDPRPVTEITFTGLAEGTAVYVIGSREYVITVTGAQHVHQWQTVSQTPATCTEEGSLTRTCSVCGLNETETIPALGHDYQDVVTPPTCTEDGYTTHACRRCGSSYTDSFTAAGHVWGEWQTLTEPACETPGLEIRVCANDPSHTETRETASLGHDYRYEVVAPTCTTDGYTQITCTRCGAGERVYSTHALGHDYVTTKVEATCTEGGYRLHTCMRCGSSYQDTVTKPLGHQYLESITEPTCSDPGFTSHTCVRCGSSFTDAPTEPLGHDWGEWQILADPTCTRDGSRIRVCSRDHAHMETEPVPALGHDYHEAFISPTCTEEGYTLHICRRCDSSFKDAFVPASGHQYRQVLAEYPTEHTCGSLLVTCGKCGDSSRISLPFVSSEDYVFSPADASYTWRNDEYGSVSFSLRGDVNGDGTVGLADVSVLFRWHTGQSELTGAAVSRGDMDVSGATDLRDIALLFRWYTGFD